MLSSGVWYSSTWSDVVGSGSSRVWCSLMWSNLVPMWSYVVPPGLMWSDLVIVWSDVVPPGLMWSDLVPVGSSAVRCGPVLSQWGPMWFHLVQCGRIWFQWGPMWSDLVPVGSSVVPPSPMRSGMVGYRSIWVRCGPIWSQWGPMRSDAVISHTAVYSVIVCYYRFVDSSVCNSDIIITDSDQTHWIPDCSALRHFGIQICCSKDLLFWTSTNPNPKGKVWKKTDTFDDRTEHWCYKVLTHVLWKENHCICVQCCQLVTSLVRHNVGHNFNSCNLMVKTVPYFSNAWKFSGKF